MELIWQLAIGSSILILILGLMILITVIYSMEYHEEIERLEKEEK